MMQGTANKTSASFAYCVRSHILHVTLGNPQTFGFESHLRTGYYHLVDDQSSSWLLYSLLLYHADKTQPGRNSCPLLQFMLGFQFGLYNYVVVQKSFLGSYLPCVIVMQEF